MMTRIEEKGLFRRILSKDLGLPDCQTNGVILTPFVQSEYRHGGLKHPSPPQMVLIEDEEVAEKVDARRTCKGASTI